VAPACLEHALDDRLDIVAPRLARMAHRGREVVGADGHAVEARNLADGVDRVHACHVLEEGVDDRLLVRAPDVLRRAEPEELGAAARGEAPRPLGRVLHCRHHPLGVGARRDVGRHDRRGPDVEVPQDHVRLVRGHADRDRHVVEVRRPDHLLALRLGDRPVLRVEEDLVRAAPGEHLHEPRGVELEAGGEDRLTGPELVLDPLATHDASPCSRR
jgi:hypothetical protein